VRKIGGEFNLVSRDGLGDIGLLHAGLVGGSEVGAGQPGRVKIGESGPIEDAGQKADYEADRQHDQCGHVGKEEGPKGID